MEVLLVAAIAAALVYFFFFRRKGEASPSSASLDSASKPKASVDSPSDIPATAPPVASPASPAPRGDSDAKAAKPQASRRRAEESAASSTEAKSASSADDQADSTPAEVEPPPPPSRGPNIGTLRRGLARSRDEAGLFGRLKQLFSADRQLDSSLVEEIEEVLLTSDVGVDTADKLLGRIRTAIQESGNTDSAAVWSALRSEALNMVSFRGTQAAIRLGSKPSVALFVGVNGAGKTTTIGKLATQLTAAGHTCVLAAGDTFRAAAVQQLKIWGKRVGCEVVHGKDGADPGSVIFDAVKKAQELGADVVLADTAGRLHTKSNLMNEMNKIDRSAGKASSGAPHETFLVLDATTGQNAVAQAKEFKNTLNLTGIILTKLDGTAKGGVVLGICDSLGVPVRYVGLGEGPDDLHEFHAPRFVDALLGDE